MPLILTHPVCLEHDTGDHPECPDRLRAIERMLKREHLTGQWERRTAKPVPLETLERVHPAEYVESVRRFAEQGGGRIESDTVLSHQSFDAALHAAGAAVQAVDAVLQQDAHKTAFCPVRPPGHHALPAKAMGFCLFNNVAVAARHARDAHGLNRVLIVDWDVHHGNGTQDIFYESPDVYFLSAHRRPFYPGTGAADETGSGSGEGTTFNLPLPFGISRADYCRRFEEMLTTAATHCRPELIFISAGFDAHGNDPIGSLGLKAEDFAVLTRQVKDVAEEYCGGRLVSLLEGGYDFDALAESVRWHLKALVETGEKRGAKAEG